MYRPLKDMRIVLTGASSGIGWHLALELARAGAVILATARRQERLEELVKTARDKVGPSARIEILPGDITLPSVRQQLIDHVVRTWNGLDVVINNAGAGAVGQFSEASPERLREVMEVDFFAPVELTRLALPWLKQGNKPAIMLIGSVLGHRAVPGKSEYCAAKFALRGWGEALRCELQPQHIDVIMLSPSTTQSEFFDRLIDTPANVRNKSVGSMPPAKVARAARLALQRNSRDVILSAGGRSLVWAGRFFPRIVDRILSNYGQPN
jgi:short-subunit dehydrogenase